MNLSHHHCGLSAPSETWSRSFCSDDFLITNLLQEIWLYRCQKGISRFLLGSLTFLALYCSLSYTSRSLASSRCRLQLPLLHVLSSSWLEGSSLLCRGSQHSWFARCCWAICIRLAHIWAAPASSSTSIPLSPLSFTWVEPPHSFLSPLCQLLSLYSLLESLCSVSVSCSVSVVRGARISVKTFALLAVWADAALERVSERLFASVGENKGSTNRSVVTKQMLQSSGAGFRSPPVDSLPHSFSSRGELGQPGIHGTLILHLRNNYISDLSQDSCFFASGKNLVLGFFFGFPSKRVLAFPTMGS